MIFHSKVSHKESMGFIKSKNSLALSQEIQNQLGLGSCFIDPSLGNHL